MYADRYAPRRVNRGSLGLSIGIVAPILTAALLTSPVVRHLVRPTPLIAINVDPVPPPPKPEPIPKPQPRTVARPIPAPVPPVPLPTRPDTVLTAPPDPVPTAAIVGPAGPDSIPTPEPTRVAPPVLVGPAVDPRYARDLQPAYPPAEERAGRDGVVTIRVLIGVDGRVRQVEQVSATSDAFWRVTERQAMTRWRFRPATRDGIPTEGWHVMTVRFTLADMN